MERDRRPWRRRTHENEKLTNYVIFVKLGPRGLLSTLGPNEGDTSMSDWGFETRQIHAGAVPDPTTGAPGCPDLSDHELHVS